MTRIQRACYLLLSILYGSVIGWFCFNWFDLSRNLPNNFAISRGSDVLDLAMFLGLTITIGFPIYMTVLPWIVAGRMKQELLPTDAPKKISRVALITTYVPGAEPLELLERTLLSMMAVRDFPGWSHDTWVLDEGQDEEVKALCRRIGARYFSRGGVEELNTIGGRFSAKSKGGNHNAWYFEVGFQDYDIVSQWDTDFQVQPQALERILPYFQDDKVAWVGTPQIYANTESFVARGAAEQGYQFYGSFNRGLSGERHSMMLGANHTVRVKALEEIGGYEAHLTEDLATGTALHARGWKSRYVPEALGLGEGPTTFSAFFKQQFRWGKGCMDLLMTSTWRKARKMPISLAIMYLWLQQFYFSGLAFGVGVLLMLLNFGFGWKGTNLPLPIFLASYIPLLLMVELAQWWLQRFNARPDVERGLYLRGRAMGALAVPTYLFAGFAAVRDRGKHTVFEVTPKGNSIEIKVKRPKGGSVYRPQIVVSTLAGGGMIVALILGNVDVVNFFWAIVLVTSGLVLATVLHWANLVALVRTHSLSFARRVRPRIDVPTSMGDLEELFLD